MLMHVEWNDVGRVLKFCQIESTMWLAPLMLEFVKERKRTLMYFISKTGYETKDHLS